MPLACHWSAAAGALFSQKGRFDPWSLAWTPAPAPADVLPVTGPEALLRLKAGPAALRRVPVAVIGPRAAQEHELALAQEVGAALAGHGLQLICGGKSGVMEAAAKGHAAAGGLPIGLVPDAEWQAASPYVAIPLATGIGPARNAIIARAAVVLVAVGGGYGTLSEMALGLQFGRLVLTLAGAPQVGGAHPCATVAEVVARVAERLLDLPVAAGAGGP